MPGNSLDIVWNFVAERRTKMVMRRLADTILNTNKKCDTQV